MSDFRLAKAILAAGSDAEIDDAARLAVLRDALPPDASGLIPAVLDDDYRAMVDGYIASHRRDHAESAAIQAHINRFGGTR